jgi:hypothetical protein
VFQHLSSFVEAVVPIIFPLRFLPPCLLLFLLGWTIVSAIRDAVARGQQMHQIPCTQCRFFTNNYRLKCTIKPYIANTEQAIDCYDYQPD